MSKLDVKTKQNTSLIGDSPELQRVLWAAKISATSDVTVLIEGESGSGKELFAQLIHRESTRQMASMISVNCAAIPDNLAESLFFGHLKGSFTGAITDQQGYIQAADKGTLFLDEVGELSLSLQAKLLRFLESSEYQQVGSTQVKHVDVRVIAATNRDLRAEIERGNFRADLFYRLYVIPLEIPSLRERRADLPLLLTHFTQALSAQYNLAAPRYSKSALNCLKTYSWPGNVRELRNLCERMTILLSGKMIEIENLPLEIQTNQQAQQKALISLPDQGLSLEKVEIELIQQALKKTTGNRSKAARLLGLTRDTLLYRMKKYSLS
jgi:transcriptional regulator with PAS, ATPase and Fis domain